MGKTSIPVDRMIQEAEDYKAYWKSDEARRVFEASQRYFREGTEEAKQKMLDEMRKSRQTRGVAQPG